MGERPDYWFPRKKNGLGWGPPVRWEGWAAVAGMLVIDAFLIVGGLLFLPPMIALVVILVGSLVTTGGFLTLCVLKGESS
ncbi:hypothetical protein [Mucisphaera sp.]|uniref:hypothetical protein n=1 Tax=Mucisphaera sp. TaxID=2913024 RepID=UPI003D0BBDB7